MMEAERFLVLGVDGLARWRHVDGQIRNKARDQSNELLTRNYVELVCT